MNPAYDNREKYERWHIRTCARCGRRAAKPANWSDGPICRTCYERAMRERGRCPGCKTERLLPGRDAAETAICRDCAAISQNSPWLFPGRRASQPMNPATLRDALRELGIPAEKGRTSAIRQLVLQAPAPVIAQALGYHDKSTTRIAAEAGAPWESYAPGDHTG